MGRCMAVVPRAWDVGDVGDVGEINYTPFEHLRLQTPLPPNDCLSPQTGTSIIVTIWLEA